MAKRKRMVRQRCPPAVSNGCVDCRTDAKTKDGFKYRICLKGCDCDDGAAVHVHCAQRGCKFVALGPNMVEKRRKSVQHMKRQHNFTFKRCMKRTCQCMKVKGLHPVNCKGADRRVLMEAILQEMQALCVRARAEAADSSDSEEDEIDISQDTSENQKPMDRNVNYVRGAAKHVKTAGNAKTGPKAAKLKPKSITVKLEHTSSSSSDEATFPSVSSTCEPAEFFKPATASSPRSFTSLTPCTSYAGPRFDNGGVVKNTDSPIKYRTNVGRYCARKSTRSTLTNAEKAAEQRRMSELVQHGATPMLSEHGTRSLLSSNRQSGPDAKGSVHDCPCGMFFLNEETLYQCHNHGSLLVCPHCGDSVSTADHFLNHIHYCCHK